MWLCADPSNWGFFLQFQLQASAALNRGILQTCEVLTKCMLGWVEKAEGTKEVWTSLLVLSPPQLSNGVPFSFTGRCKYTYALAASILTHLHVHSHKWKANGRQLRHVCTVSSGHLKFILSHFIHIVALTTTDINLLRLNSPPQSLIEEKKNQCIFINVTLRECPPLSLSPGGAVRERRPRVLHKYLRSTHYFTSCMAKWK